ADDPSAGMATQQPRRQGNRDDKRFERAGRQVEDQTLAGLAVDHQLEVVADHVDVPVGDQPLAWVDGLEGAISEGPEIGPVDRVGEVSIDLHFFAPFLPSELMRRGPKRRRIRSSSSSTGLISAAAGSDMTRA